MGIGGYSKYESTAPGNVDPSVLEQLPSHLKQQFESYAAEQSKIVDDLKEKYEKLQVDSEQKYFEVENQLVATNTKLESESSTASELKKQLNDIEKKYNDASSRVRELQAAQFENNERCDSLEQSNRHLTADKEDLSYTVDKKTKENDSLTENWKQMSEKLNEANRNRIDALAKLDEIKSKGITSQHHEHQLKQDKVLLEQQNEWLQREISEKTNQLLSARKEQAEKILELQTGLQNKSDEVDHLQLMVDNLRDTKDDLNVKIEGYLEKLQDARNNQNQLEEQYRAEIHSQEKLITIYKNASVVKEKQVEELTPAVDELQRLLKVAAEERVELEKERDTEYVEWQKKVDDCEEIITELKRELVDSNELIEAMKKKGILPPTEDNVEALSPAAAAASRLLKSGMTLTQIYSSYVQVSENLHVEKDENQRLNKYLDEILQEIEEKAPVLKKQREDYEKALETINLLTGQLDTAMVECQKLQVEADESQRRKNEVSRENLRLQQSSIDLGQQVRMLLKELEEARGTVVSTINTSMDVSVGEVSSSSAVISEKLVTFKSIEELQEQNQRLLEVVRELSETREKEEAEGGEKRVRELKEQLDRALSDMDEMKAARQRQADMVESIVRQRDMYRLMLQQTGGSPGVATSPKGFSTPMGMSTIKSAPLTPSTPATPPGPRKSPMVGERGDAVLEETKDALKELQEDFSVYRREKGENEKILNEQLDKLKSETTEMRVLNAKLSAQLDFSSERYKVLQSNVEGYKKEINALRDKTTKLTASNAKHEQTGITLREDLMSTKEKLSRAETLAQNLRVEKDMLKAVEGRLTQERETMLAETRSRDMLLVNLQAIQNNLDRAEFETKSKYTQKIDLLEKENGALRRKLDGINDEQRKRGAALEKQLADTRAELDRERNTNRGSHDKIQALNDELGVLTLKLEESDAELQLTKQQDTAPKTLIRDPAKEEELKDLRTKLSHSTSELNSVKSHLEESRKQTEQYKSIAASVEESLKEQNEISKQLEEAVTNQLDEAKETQQQLEAKLQETEGLRMSLEQERDSLAKENAKLSQDSQYLGVNQRKQLEGLQKELRRLTDDLETARNNEATARKDSEGQAQLAQEVQEKYQKELMNHASDVSTLTGLREQLDGFTEKLQKAEESATEAQEILETSKMSWKEQEQLLKSAQTTMEAKVQELQKQNRMVHEELEALSLKMSQLHQNKEREEREQQALEDSMSHADEERSSEQLLEVIRFIRKEKDIAEARLEVVQAEATRTKQQADYLTRQLNDATASLQEERQKAQVTMQTAAQHADLIRKVETMNLLQDSNKMLREEKERMAQQISDHEAKVSSLEAQLTPLQESKRYLQGQYEALEAERNALQAEVQRWKVRTNHLIEQCNKADPEEFKRMMEERDQLRQTLASTNSTLEKNRSDLQSAANLITVNQGELKKLQATVTKLNEEVASLKAEVEAQSKDQEEKQKTMTRLRTIARKYRVQAEDVQQELTTLKASDTAREREAEHQAKIKELEEKQKKTDDDLAKVTTDLGASESEKSDINKSLKEKEAKLQALSAQLNRVNGELVKERGQSKDARESLGKANESLRERLKESQELDKKFIQSRSILSSAKLKLNNQKQEIDRYLAENQELRTQNEQIQAKLVESEAAVSALRSQSQAQRDGTESSSPATETSGNEALTQELEKLKKENSELIVKVQQLQRQLETVQKPQPSATTRPKVSASAADRPGTSTGEAVKTANIKPMTTPTTTSRPIQSALVQPVRSSPGDRFRASVPPMTVSMTTAMTTTPTATVMPTTVTVQDTETVQMSSSSLSHPQISPQQSQSQPGAQVRPMQQVQPVTQRVDDVQDAPEPQSDPAPIDTLPPPASQSSDLLPPPPSQSVDILPPPAQSLDSLPGAESSSSSPVEDSSAPSTSHGAGAAGPTTSSVGSKRARDETETVDDSGSTSMKRTKTTETPEAIEPSTASGEPEEIVAPVERRESTIEVAMVEPAVQQQQQQQQQQPQQQEAQQQPEQPTPAVPRAVLLPAFEDDNLALESGASEAEGYEEGQGQEVAEEAVEEEVVADEEQQEEPEEIEDEEEEIPPYEEEAVEQEEYDEASTVDSQYDEEVEQQNTGEDVEGAIVLIDDDEDEEEEDEVEDEPEDEEVEEGEGDEEEDGEEGVEEEEEDVDQMDEYDEEEAEEGDEDEEEQEYQEGMQEEYDEEDEEMDEELDEPMQAEAEEEEDDDDVIVVDDDPSPEDAAMEPPSEEPQAAASRPATEATMPAVPAANTQRRQPSQTGLMPAGRAQQLPSFSFGEQGAFDVGDDGIVPSTPTLLIPRRHDDFAQAVSSPQVQRRFVFGSGNEANMQNPEFARLETQGALGVDDIRMDLTQFDDATGSGRNVPVAPATQTTPTISITEPSPPRDTPEGSGGQGRVSPGVAPSPQPEDIEQDTTAQQAVEQAEQSASQTDAASSEGDVFIEKGQGEGAGLPQEAETSEQSADVEHSTDSQDKTEEEKASTSADAQDKPDASSSSSGQKPKIQRIVWDNPAGSGSSTPVMSASPQPQQAPSVPQRSPGQAGIPPAQQRKFTAQKFRGQVRGQGMSRAQRPMHRGAGPHPQQQMGQQLNVVMGQGMQRGRGARGAKRGPYHQQQQHRHQPF